MEMKEEKEEKEDGQIQDQKKGMKEMKVLNWMRLGGFTEDRLG